MQIEQWVLVYPFVASTLNNAPCLHYTIFVFHRHPDQGGEEYGTFVYRFCNISDVMGEVSSFCFRSNRSRTSSGTKTIRFACFIPINFQAHSTRVVRELTISSTAFSVFLTLSYWPNHADVSCNVLNVAFDEVLLG